MKPDSTVVQAGEGIGDAGEVFFLESPQPESSRCLLRDGPGERRDIGVVQAPDLLFQLNCAAQISHRLQLADAEFRHGVRGGHVGFGCSLYVRPGEESKRRDPRSERFRLEGGLAESKAPKGLEAFLVARPGWLGGRT